MQLSIREASRFFIGAAILRARAIEASGNAEITLDNVAVASLRDGSDGKKLRLSIDKLADEEESWMRSTPPHTLKTERVIQSREAEIRTFTAINAAVIATLELEEQAIRGEPAASAQLHKKYMTAFEAIDSTPGSTQDRRQLKELLASQTSTISVDSSFVTKELRKADKAYTQAVEAAILSRYVKLERSDDFDM